VTWLLQRDAHSVAQGKRAKLYEWLRRYGVAECAGITCALLGSFVVRQATGSAIAAAYGAAWGESIGYGGTIITRDFLAESRITRAAHRVFGIGDCARVLTALLAEFGPAGVLDTLVTRPLAMALGTRLLGFPFGVIAGKVAADVLFYLPVIFMYERKKRWHRQSPPRT
jgi:hypothetical protein